MSSPSKKDIYSYLQDEALEALKESTKTLLRKNEISFAALKALEKTDLKQLNISVGEVALLFKFAKKHSSSSPTAENCDIEEEAQQNTDSSDSVEQQQNSHTDDANSNNQSDPNSCDFNNNNSSNNNDNQNAASAAAASPQTPGSNFSSWLKNSDLALDLQQLLFNKGISCFNDVVEISKKTGGLSDLVDENFGFETQLEMFLEKEQKTVSATESLKMNLNNTTVAGSAVQVSGNNNNIDARKITSNTTNIFNNTNNSNNKQISEWLSKQTQLTRASQQACANHGFDTEENFALLFDCENLGKLNLDLPVKQELENIINQQYVAIAKVTLESCKKVLRKGNEKRYEQRLIGGRNIPRKDTFQQLRIYSNANKNNRNTETPSSPSSPTKTYDETNEGAVINGQDLPSVALKGSNLVVVNGVAGTGKTYLCEMLAIEQNVPNALVINVPLRDLLAAENVNVESVSDLLEFSVGDMLDEKQIRTISLGQVPLIFLLDGFDEVQWSAPTSNMGNFLHHFVDPVQRAKNAQNPKFKNLVRSCDVVVVTSREERTRNEKVVDLDDPDATVDHWNLMLWNNDQVLSYSKKWFTAMMREDTSFDVDKAAIDVVSVFYTVRENEKKQSDTDDSLRSAYMQHFSGLPLFVNMICEIKVGSSKYANQLNSLTPSKVFELLFESFWERSRIKIQQRLSEVAADYKLSKNTEIDEELLATLMEEAAMYGFKQLVQPVIQDFTAITFDLSSLPNNKPPLFAVLFESAGLLRFVSEKKARFPHRSYIEFLCAKFASENPATALIVPPVVDETLPKEKQEKVPETILWTQKFATVWLILADFARRNEDEYQQEKKRTSFFSSVNYSKIYIETFIKHLAQVHFNKNKENDQKFDMDKGSEIACTLTLLRLTMIIPASSCNQLLDGIKNSHGIHFKTPRHFLWLVELAGKVGALQALEWVEKNYKKDVTQDLLKLTLGHALDRQELPSVAQIVGFLTQKRNVPVSLKHAVKTGSVVGTTIAATSAKENIFDVEAWTRYLKLVFERQQYDVAAVLLMHGDWKNDTNKNLFQFLPFSLPKSVSEESLSSEVVFTLVVSRLPSNLRIWNSEKQTFDHLPRSSVAEKCGVQHLKSEADQLLFFFVSVAPILKVPTILEMKVVAAEMKLDDRASVLEDPLLAALTIVAGKEVFDDEKWSHAAAASWSRYLAESWSCYLKTAFDRQQYDVATVLLKYGDWNNNENSRHLLPLLPCVLEPEKFPLPPNFAFDLQGLKSSLFLKLPSSIRIWNTSTNSFEKKSRDIVASFVGLNDIESCRVSCAKFLEEAAIACHNQFFTLWKHEKPANDGFINKLVQAYDSTISQDCIETVLNYLRVATTEFWMLTPSDISCMIGEENAVQADQIFKAQQYLMSEEHWNELKIPVDAQSVECFLSKEYRDAIPAKSAGSTFLSKEEAIPEDVPDEAPLDSYRVPAFVSQLVKITPKRSETVVIQSLLFRNFAFLSVEGQKLLGRQEVVNSLIASSQYCTSAEAVYCWTVAIYSIVFLESNRKLFCCSSFRDAFVAVSKYATTCDAVHWWVSALQHITLLESNKNLFGCQAVVDSVVAVRNYVSTAVDVQLWSSAIASIIGTNELNKKFFGCQAVVDSFVTVSKFATSADAVGCWSSAIRNITYHNESNGKLFGCSSIVDSFTAVSEYATSHDATSAVAVRRWVNVDSFATVSKYATTSKAVRRWIGAINNITISEDVDICRAFRSSAEFKQAFFSLKQKFEQMPEDEDTREAKRQFGYVEKRLF